MNFNELYKKIASLDENVEEGNAFSGALSQTDKGEEFKVGGKTFTDTGDYKKEVSEEIDTEDIKHLASLLANGEISFDEFNDKINDLRYTDYSMRQGEMGFPNVRDGVRSGRHTDDDWDQMGEPEDREDRGDDFDGDFQGDLPDRYESVDGEISEGAPDPAMIEEIRGMLKQNMSPEDIAKKLGSIMPGRPSAKEIKSAATLEKIKMTPATSADYDKPQPVSEPATQPIPTAAPVDPSVGGAIKNIKQRQELLKNDVDVNECGSMMVSGPPSSPPQQDSVSMSVNMNGSGKGGIRDLLNILKDIEGTGGSDDFRLGHGKMTIIDEPAELGDIMDSTEDEGFANTPAGSSGPHKFGLGAVMHDGNDIHKSTKKNFTFGNPEEIKVHLESLYQKYKTK